MFVTALRAPAEDGAVLAVPPLERAGELIDANHRALAAGPLGEIRQLARRELRALVGAAEGPLLLAGHQPELFHPGVWAKNFALAGLARRHGGAGVNLLIDSDTVKATTIRVPVQGPHGPVLRTVAFDGWRGEVPWEERHVADAGVFAAFGGAVTAIMRGWGVEPLAARLWPRVCALVGEGPLGEALAAARREVERDWGCANAEVPLSAVCATEAFAHFAGRLLGELPRLAEAYNAAVRDYRRRHRLRSRSHPVPELASDGDWGEAPLWAWRGGEGRRHRLFVRATPSGLVLRAGGEAWAALPPPGERTFLEAWRDLARQGLKVRSRALTTTLFARLYLADLFIHGIGGAKYDELTDGLMRRFFAVAPPAFLALSATRLLPLPAPAVTEDDRRRLARRLRDLRYNPQRHLEGDHPAIGQKRELAAWSPERPAERRSRFGLLRQANEALAPLVRDKEEETRRELADAERQLAARAVLRRRDYSLCLYPEEALRPFLARLA